MHLAARWLFVPASAALFVGCAVEAAPSTRLLGSSEEFAAAGLTAPATPAGPLPAPMTRDPASPAQAGSEGFSSPPGNTGGNPTPTPAAPPTSPATSGANASADPFEPARAFCVQRINQYRATLGLPLLTRAPYAESCADRQAQYDGSMRTAHAAFSGCGEFAQNECPGWGGALTSALPGCLASMWSEGPGGGHYEAMASKSYRYVACGISQTATGWWIVHDFR